MADYNVIQTKIDDLKAKVEIDSITPIYMGSLLEDMIDKAKEESDRIDNIKHPVSVIDTNEADLIIADSKNNAIVTFVDGHLKTANFDSRSVLDAIDNESSARMSADDAISDAIEDLSETVSSEVARLDNDIANVPHPVSTIETDEADLVLADENDNAIATFSNGHIRTANFDSRSVLDAIDNESSARMSADDAISDAIEDLSETVSSEVARIDNDIANVPHPVSTIETDEADLVLADENDNAIATFSNGHIRTANFDSSQIDTNLPIKAVNTDEADLVLADESENAIATFVNGHVSTANFNSFETNNGYSSVYFSGFSSTNAVVKDSTYYLYRGLNVAFSQAAILSAIEIRRDSGDAVGDSVTILAGLIDQRGWLVNQHSVSARIASVVDDIATIIPDSFFVINKGDYIFVSVRSQNNNLVVNSSSSNSMYKLLEYGLPNDSSDIAVNTFSSKRLACFKVYWADFAAINLWQALRSALVDASDALMLAQEANINAAAVRYLVDDVTGYKYSLAVSDGVLAIKKVGYQNVLVIGNSFTNHAPVSSYGWNCTRGMAASTPDSDYCSYLADGLDNANVVRAKIGSDINCAAFERNFSPSYNFANFSFDRSKEYELIVFQLNENASYSSTMQSSWTAMYSYFKSLYPSAKLIQVIGWDTSSKTAAIAAACADVGVSLLNCNAETYTANFVAGAYNLADDNQLYAITSTIITHPSDVGMLLIANRILAAAGYDALDYLHNINITSVSGVTITTMMSGGYRKAAYKGLVTLQVSGASDISVSQTSGASVSVTKVSDSIFTFIMPNADVTITATV